MIPFFEFDFLWTSGGSTIETRCLSVSRYVGPFFCFSAAHVHPSVQVRQSDGLAAIEKKKTPHFCVLLEEREGEGQLSIVCC